MTKCDGCNNRDVETNAYCIYGETFYYCEFCAKKFMGDEIKNG